jgi:hypothetical protein
MDTNKPQTSDEEGAQPPPLLARSPYRPLSLRRRQARPADPQPAVARPKADTVFTVSPNTVAAALANRNGPNETALVWGRGGADGAAEATGNASAAKADTGEDPPGK